MMNYRKGRNVETELTRTDIQIEALPEQFLWMHVKGGTNVSNVVEFAKNALQTGEHRAVVWTGYGGGVGKTISSVEILKRDFTLHQVTRLCYKTDEEYWDPLIDGLEPIVVRRNIPCIHILISLDAIDPQTSGYQFSKHKTPFWQEVSVNKQKTPPSIHRYKDAKNSHGHPNQSSRKSNAIKTNV